MNNQFGWCFLGAGSIVSRVMPEMHKTDGGFLASIYAPSFINAETVAKKYGAKVYHSAQEAIIDPNVRAVYVATPHTNHMESTLLAIKLGKPVLCEKPFAVNAKQANKMITAAKSAGVYLQEGMWTRHNPMIKKVLEWIKNDEIGKVRFFTANMAFRSEIDPTSRVFDYNRAGGTLLDIGVYAIAASIFIFDGKPNKISSIGELAFNGIDRSCAINLGFEDKGIAQLFTASSAAVGADAVIYGQKGKIIVPNFAAPIKAELITDDTHITFSPEIYHEGFAYEFNSVMDDVRKRKLENEFVSHEYSLNVMEIMDEIRKQIGLRYNDDN